MNNATVNEKGCNVLLVDDCEDMANLVKAHLADPKVNVTVTTSGRGGIQAFKEGAFDLVLMDLNMPDIDGFEATRAIRFWEWQRGLRRTPIAALTASSSGTAIAEIFNSGCDHYLAKPITRNILLQTVGQYFAASRRGLAARAHAA